MSLHVSSTVVLIIRRSDCIIQHLLSSHSVGIRQVHRFIVCLYMFRALLCSSSGGQIVLYSIAVCTVENP